MAQCQRGRYGAANSLAYAASKQKKDAQRWLPATPPPKRSCHTLALESVRASLGLALAPAAQCPVSDRTSSISTIRRDAEIALHTP